MIKDLRGILEVLRDLGIDEAVIEQTDDPEQTRVRAANVQNNIIVYDEIDVQIVTVKRGMGIQSVRGLLSRLDLFDLDKASFDVRLDGDVVGDLILKEGRKKVSFGFASPSRVLAPSKLPEVSDVHTLVLEPEYVKYLGKAMTAMTFTGDKEEQSLSIRGSAEHGTAEISIVDGDTDSFSEVLPTDIGNSAGSWEVAPFRRVIAKALDYQPTGVPISIDEYRIATVDLGILRVKIVPKAA